MKKIVLYTIGALCLLSQNGIGSDDLGSRNKSKGYPEKKIEKIIGYDKEHGIRTETWIHLPRPAEMKEITDHMSRLASKEQPSWSEIADLFESSEKCKRIFAQQHRFPLEKIEIALILGNKHRGTDGVISRYDDNSFRITGEKKSDENSILVAAETTWGPDLPYESMRMKVILDSSEDKKETTDLMALQNVDLSALFNEEE